MALRTRSWRTPDLCRNKSSMRLSHGSPFRIVEISGEFHGLNSGNIAQIQHIHCPSCRDCWICHVNKRGKRREPEPPPGLKPREPMEDVSDVGRDMGTFLNLVNSGRAESQNLATFGGVAQGSFSASPLYGCIDATDTGFHGLCPNK